MWPPNIWQHVLLLLPIFQSNKIHLMTIIYFFFIVIPNKLHLPEIKIENARNSQQLRKEKRDWRIQTDPSLFASGVFSAYIQNRIAWSWKKKQLSRHAGLLFCPFRTSSNIAIAVGYQCSSTPAFSAIPVSIDHPDSDGHAWSELHSLRLSASPALSLDLISPYAA